MPSELRDGRRGADIKGGLPLNAAAGRFEQNQPNVDEHRCRQNDGRNDGYGRVRNHANGTVRTFDQARFRVGVNRLYNRESEEEQNASDRRQLAEAPSVELELLPHNGQEQTNSDSVMQQDVLKV